MRTSHSACSELWIPLLLVTAAATAAAVTAAAQQPTVVSPPARSGLEGNASTFYPLGRAKARFQQLHGDLGQGQLIKGHAYRRDGLTSRGQVGAFQTEMAISLSRAALTPEKVSTTFTQNGGSPTAVLARTTLSFVATQKPTGLAPAPFLLRVPYKTPFGWDGKGTLCVEMVLHGNQTPSGQDKNFMADLDGHELFSSGRSDQPGIPYGQGCTARSATSPAQATFLVRHLGKTSDLRIDVTDGVPTTSANTPAQSAVIVGPGQRNQAWPPATGCTLYADPTVILFLAGNNDAKGAWSGTVPLGAPVAPHTSMFAQVASLDRNSGELVLTNGAQLTMPPASPGLIAARVAHGTDPAAATGTISYSVPVTLFF